MSRLASTPLKFESSVSTEIKDDPASMYIDIVKDSSLAISTLSVSIRIGATIQYHHSHPNQM